MKILACLLLLIWCAQGASRGHIHYVPGTATPATTRVITITGLAGQDIQPAHRNGIRDDNCPLCQLSVHMAVLTVPQLILILLISHIMPRITPILPRIFYAAPRSHHWIGRAPPR